LTESDYLHQQAEDAAAAMSATLHDMADAIRGSVDVPAWTRQYPWIATSTALVAGFVAASALVPGPAPKTRVERATGRWGKVKAAWADVFQPEAAAASHEIPKVEREVHTEAKKGESWVSSVLSELFKTLRPVLIGLITGAMRPPQSPPVDGHDGGGMPAN